MMSRVRSTGNRAEAGLRKELWRRGHRCRRYYKGLVGRPDLVFTKARVVVFVDGDFWHGRALAEGGRRGLRGVIRGPRFDWWLAKLRRNAQRDIEVTSALTTDGWTVLRYWESDVLRDGARVANDVSRVIRKSGVTPK